MAWKKDVEYETGIVVGYWEPLEAKINFTLQTADISYLGWVDQDAKDGGKAAVIQESISLSISDLPNFQLLKGFVENKVLTTVDKFLESTPI